MIDLENKIERDKLIDDYFNKGYACDIREVYQAVVNTIADLEYANDEKIKEIERLKEDNEYLNKVNIELSTEKNRLNNIINEFDKWLDEESEKTILSTGHLTCLMMCKNKLQELKGSDKE